MKALWVFCAIACSGMLPGCSLALSKKRGEGIGQHLPLQKRDVDSSALDARDLMALPREEEFLALREEEVEEMVPILFPSRAEEHEDPVVQIDISRFVAPDEDLKELFATLYFGADSCAFWRREDYGNLTAIADYMRENPHLYLLIMAHSDERSSHAYNLALSAKRAHAVRRLLIEKGVDPSRIYEVPFGEEMPIDRGHTEEAWAKNRRVEFRIFEGD